MGFINSGNFGADSHCPFCQHEQPDVKFTASGFTFYKCKKCRSLFRWDCNIIKEYNYEESYYGDSKSEKFWFKPVVWFLNIERSRRAAYIAKNISKESSVLDIGCGNGALVHKVYKISGAKVSGVEMDNVAANRAKQYGHITVFSNSFEKAPLIDNSFDTISMIHSFEHIPFPLNTLYKIDSLLKQKGFFYLAIPNINSIQYKIFGRYWLHLDPEFHLHFVDKQQLMTLMTNHKYRQVKTVYFNPIQNISGFILSTLNLITGKRDVLFNMLKSKRKFKNPLNILLFLILMLISVILLPIGILEECISVMLKRGATADYVFIKE